jgi:hypothetical protein
VKGEGETGGGIDTLEAPLPAGAVSYPALTPEIEAAFWYERVIHDETGLIPEGHPRLAPLVAPGSPEDRFHLVRTAAGPGAPGPRRVPAWRSATIGVDGADSYTPSPDQPAEGRRGDSEHEADDDVSGAAVDHLVR